MSVSSGFSGKPLMSFGGGAKDALPARGSLGGKLRQLVDMPPWEEPGWRGLLPRRTLFEAGVHLVDYAMILFDARAPDALGSALPGGNGIAFDWTLLKGENATPFMLSGGLDCSNVAEAIHVTGAPVVDVSSGVERAPGIKDAGLIRKFIETARGPR